MTLWIGMVVMALCAVSLLWIPVYRYPNDAAATGGQHTRPSFLNAWRLLVSLLLIGVPLGIYEQTRWPAWKAWQQQRAAQAIDVHPLGDVQTVISRMQMILAQHPQSAQGWFLLGRLYESQGQVEKALAAFKKAYTLEGTKMDYLMAYAEAFSAAHRGLLDAALRVLLTQAQQAPDAFALVRLHLLALDAYTRRDFKTAIQKWEQSVALTSPQSPERDIILRWLGKAQTS